MGKTIDIRMVCTARDTKLLKKILRKYMEQCSAGEKRNYECYIGLIEYAEKQAEGRDE